ncbi:MAG: alkaline phosphatase family protein [Acidimicrobiia bacterium]
MFTAPDYTGGSLLNLVAELEHRLTGEAPHPGLHPDLAASIPNAASYVLILFDGLGDGQLDHPAAEPFRTNRAGALDAPFPTTTTVSLATVATGRSPAEHGLLAYQLWLPETGVVVNTIKWTSLWGEPFVWDHRSFLPQPNLWERLRAHGVEAITVQPHNFEQTPLSTSLYRGARFEGYSDEHDAVHATVQLAAEPSRLVFLYVPHVDFAAHTVGQQHESYDDAMQIASRMWERVALSLPPNTVAVGTADHGHVDIAHADQFELTKAHHEDREFGGDARALFVWGDRQGLPDLPADWVSRTEMEHWWGPGTRHPEFDNRAPDGVFMAHDGRSVLHRHADDRLIGHHGGLTEAERRIPLLIASRS